MHHTPGQIDTILHTLGQTDTIHHTSHTDTIHRVQLTPYTTHWVRHTIHHTLGPADTIHHTLGKTHHTPHTLGQAYTLHHTLGQTYSHTGSDLHHTPHTGSDVFTHWVWLTPYTTHWVTCIHTLGLTYTIHTVSDLHEVTQHTHTHVHTQLREFSCALQWLHRHRTVVPWPHPAVCDLSVSSSAWPPNVRCCKSIFLRPLPWSDRTLHSTPARKTKRSSTLKIQSSLYKKDQKKFNLKESVIPLQERPKEVQP